ncbi:hypothetical protein JMJ35_002239 [Cladonia borealis]|uniref:DNA replication complex GINS protein SLD5 n=1 Tax=Cladonia borealis TaxID=184061 RepID=A0AA39V9A1_9LECA|nr:hypothetical protein JMJ35_002239 [Cladonia borealis]
MDIDDILAEVDDSTIPQETRDLQELTRTWVNERSAPELLPWPAELMDRVLERIRQQISLIEDRTSSTDPKSSFTLIILQTELERFKYLTRSLLRARLAKIDAFPLHTLTHAPTRALLSPSELQYATTHTAILHRHFQNAFLGQFPEGLRKMDDSSGGVNMVEGPDLEKAVFVRGRREAGVVIGGEGVGKEFLLGKGEVVVVRWGVVREVVGRGEAELI